MTMGTRTVQCGIAVVAMAISQAVSAATLTPALDSVVFDPIANNYIWSYTVSEDAAGRVTGGAVPGALEPARSAPGDPDEEGLIADYFTIFDFGGYISGSATTPAGWAFQSLLLGSRNVQHVVDDDASVPNLTWYYTGATAPGPFTQAGFSARSVYGLPVAGEYAGEDTHNQAGEPADGDTDLSLGSISVPGPQQQLPEPGTAALAGLAALGLLARRLRRR